MNEFVYSLMYKGKIGYLIARMLFGIWHFFSFRLYLSDKKVVEIQFQQAHGYKLYLANPITINEKMQWLKLYDRTPLHTQYADKYKVRMVYEQKFGSDGLVELIFSTDNWKEVKKDNMPNFPFIIKPNHGSGWYHIIMDKNEVDWNKVRTDCRYWLSLNPYYMQREWPYKDIPRKILVERLLISREGLIPTNYRVHCFHGRVELIALTIYETNDTKKYRNQKYSRDWELLNIDWAFKDVDINLIRDLDPKPKPILFEEMIFRAELLSKAFKYVRVDFFVVDEKLYHGEMTFFDGGGYEKISPYEWDIKLGSYLKLD